MFTVVTDQHSTAISVQAVDDAGYSLNVDWPSVSSDGEVQLRAVQAMRLVHFA